MVKLYKLTQRGFEVIGLTIVKETPKQYQYDAGRKNPDRLNKFECNKIQSRWREYHYYDTEDLPLEEIVALFDTIIINDMLSVRDVFERETEKLVKIRKKLTE